MKAPTRDEFARLAHTIARRVADHLGRREWLDLDSGTIYVTPEALDAPDEDPSNQLLRNSTTYRIAVGPWQGRKVFTLQTLPDCESDNPTSGAVGEVADNDLQFVFSFSVIWT